MTDVAKATAISDFSPYLAAWDLHRDGAPIATRGSRLLPVRSRGEPAMLKLSAELEERAGAALLDWWAGDGAARVLARDGGALLLERATGTRSLAVMARGGADAAATRIICGAVAALHAPRPGPPPDLVPLARWFRALEPAATHGGILSAAWAQARVLLAAPHEATILHGDIHHGNILDFGARGWLAIDPKGLVGAHAFDYANLFCNPDVATASRCFATRLAIVSEETRLARTELLRWIVAWAGLSAAWDIADGKPCEAALAMAEMAAAELRR